MTARVFGILALVAMVLSYQQKDRKKLLWFQLVSNAIYGIHYGLIGAYTMTVMSGVNVARSFVFSKNDTRWGKSRIWPYLFLVITLVGGILSWQGPLSLLVIVATLLLTITLYSENLAFMRKMFLILPFLYLPFNIWGGEVISWEGIGNDVFCIISALIAIWRFDIKKKKADEEKTGQDSAGSEEA